MLTYNALFQKFNNETGVKIVSSFSTDALIDTTYITFNEEMLTNAVTVEKLVSKVKRKCRHDDTYVLDITELEAIAKAFETISGIVEADNLVMLNTFTPADLATGFRNATDFDFNEI